MGRPRIRKDYTATAWLEPFALGRGARDELIEIAEVAHSPEQSASMLGEVERALGEYCAQERILDQRPRDASIAEELSRIERPVAQLAAAVEAAEADLTEACLNLAATVESDLAGLTEPASSAVKRTAYDHAGRYPRPHEICDALRLFQDSDGGKSVNYRADLAALLERFAAAIATTTARLRESESRGRTRRDANAYLVATLSRVYRKYAPRRADMTASLDLARDPIRHDRTTREPSLHGGRLELDFIVTALRGAGIDHPQDREALSRRIRG